MPKYFIVEVYRGFSKAFRFIHERETPVSGQETGARLKVI